MQKTITLLNTMASKENCGLPVKSTFKLTASFCLVFGLPFSTVCAQENNLFASTKETVTQWLAPQPNTDFNKADVKSLSNFEIDTSKIPDLGVVTSSASLNKSTSSDANLLFGLNDSLSLQEAIVKALQRNPDISEALANVAAQSANIDVSKAAYYPQLSGGIGTADLTKGEKGRQVISLDATQMVYDFGKIKSDVTAQEAQLAVEQAGVLVAIDAVALQTAEAIVNTKRYQQITRIAEQQIQGISKIAEIANLRARAGISSQADPIQAQSNLEAARANFILQQNQMRQHQQKLRTLLGFDIANVQWDIPDRLVKESDLYAEVQFNQVPEMMVAQGRLQVAKFEKEKTRLSNYPTLSLKGSLSQAVNGKNPNNNKDDGFYNSIMLEASSNFYQGGSTASRVRAASYAEEAAKSRMNTVYLDVLDEVRLLREEIDNKQKQMGVLLSRQETAIRTKELYQEQYKLGTRTVVDLLNAEQSIHSAAQEIENARYDIYAAIVKYIAKTGRTRAVYDLNDVAIQGFEIQS